MGVGIIVDTVYKGCVVTMGRRQLLVKVVLMDIRDFDAILGMDWLASYHPTVDYFQKRIMFMMLGLPEFGVVCSRVLASPYLISVIQAK